MAPNAVTTTTTTTRRDARRLTRVMVIHSRVSFLSRAPTGPRTGADSAVFFRSSSKGWSSVPRSGSMGETETFERVFLLSSSGNRRSRRARRNHTLAIGNKLRGGVRGVALYSPRRAASREAPPKRWCSVSLTAVGAYRARATPRGRSARAARGASGPARKALPRQWRPMARRARRSAPRATGRRAEPPRASAPCFLRIRCRTTPRSYPRRAARRRLRRVARASMRASSSFRVFSPRPKRVSRARPRRSRRPPTVRPRRSPRTAGTRTRPGRTRCASSASPAAL